MRKTLVLASLVLLTAALGACVPSVYPLYTDKDLRFEPVLIGTWAEKPEADETWTFTKADDTSYGLVVTIGLPAF